MYAEPLLQFYQTMMHIWQRNGEKFKWLFFRGPRCILRPIWCVVSWSISTGLRRRSELIIIGRRLRMLMTMLTAAAAERLYTEWVVVLRWFLYSRTIACATSVSSKFVHCIIGRQSNGSIIRGFDNRPNPNPNPRPIYSTYMTVWLTTPRIIDTPPFFVLIGQKSSNDGKMLLRRKCGTQRIQNSFHLWIFVLL